MEPQWKNLNLSTCIFPLIYDMHGDHKNEIDIQACVAYMYTKNIIKDRWKDGEHIILKSPYYTVKYSKMINENWEEFEKQSDEFKRKCEYYRNFWTEVGRRFNESVDSLIKSTLDQPARATRINLLPDRK